MTETEQEIKNICPWCNAPLDEGVLKGDFRGCFWYEKKSSKFKRFWTFTGESLGREFIALRCSKCKKIVIQLEPKEKVPKPFWVSRNKWLNMDSPKK